MGSLISYSWRKFITLVQGSRGPFSVTGKMGNTRKLYELAVKLFREGPPTAGIEWVAGANCGVEDYVYLFRKLFKKNDLFALAGRFFYYAWGNVGILRWGC